MTWQASERPSDDEEGSVADSEDEEAVEIAQRQKLLNEEIRDLETAVARKKTEIAASSNAIIKVSPPSHSHPFPLSCNLDLMYPAVRF